MSKQKAILTLALVSVAILLLKLGRTANRRSHTAISSPSLPADVQKEPVITISPSRSKSRDRAIDEKNINREEAYRRAFAARIDFFGRVIDERGKAIEGAHTSYIVTTASLAGNPTEVGPQTDLNGAFSLTGRRGPRLVVMVSHPKYYRTKTAEQVFDYAEPNAMNSLKLPTRPDPAIFVLQSHGKTEVLIHDQFIKVLIPTNGTPVDVNLYNGRIGLGADSIRLILKSQGDKLPMNQYYPFDWGFTIEVPGGGIQARTNELQFQAPSDGYRKDISFSNAASLTRGQWQGTLDSEFSFCYLLGIMHGSKRIWWVKKALVK